MKSKNKIFTTAKKTIDLTTSYEVAFKRWCTGWKICVKCKMQLDEEWARHRRTRKRLSLPKASGSFLLNYLLCIYFVYEVHVAITFWLDIVSPGCRIVNALNSKLYG